MQWRRPRVRPQHVSHPQTVCRRRPPFQLHFLLQLGYILPGPSLIGIAVSGVFAVFMLFAVHQLHYSDVGGWPMDALLFFLSVATSVVILTGNVLWIVVRRPKDDRATPLLHRFLGRLTIGVGCGLVAAVPVIFILAQVLPDDMASRKVWEEGGFFIAWGIFLLAAFLGPSPRLAVRWQLGLAAVLCVAAVLANGFVMGA